MTTNPASPQLTSEVFAVPVDGERTLLFAPLQRAAFLGNQAMVDWLARLRCGRVDGGANDTELVAFLRSLQIVDGPGDVQPPGGPQGTPQPTAVTLFLTTACSLRCTYCYAMAGDTPVRSMPLEVARAGIEFVVANAVRTRAERIDIAYHGGGEPTVNWQTLTGSLAHARALAAPLGLGVHTALASNAVIADDRIDWILANIDSASISFDGAPDVHDRHRPVAGGGGSSDRVLHTLRRFDAAGFDYGIRMTVTADQIDELPRSVAFVCRHLSPRAIQVEPAYPLGRYRDAPTAETASFVAAFRQARAIAREAGHDLRFSGARGGMVTNHFCGVTRDSFALSPDGNVSSCYEVFDESLPLADEFFYGRRNSSGFEFDLARLARLRAKTVDHKPFCAGCFAKWSCAGDCHHRAMATGQAEFAGSDRCHIIRELTKDQILEHIAAAGGVFWHAPPADSDPPAAAGAAPAPDP